MTKKNDSGKIFSGKKLQLMRVLAGMEIQDLVEQLGTNNSVVWKYESQNNEDRPDKDGITPRPDRLKRMADILDCSVDDFFIDPDQEKRNKAAIDSLSVRLSHQDKSFVYFFLSRPRMEKERLLGILQGMLLSDLQMELRDKS